MSGGVGLAFEPGDFVLYLEFPALDFGDFLVGGGRMGDGFGQFRL